MFILSVFLGFVLLTVQELLTGDESLAIATQWQGRQQCVSLSYADAKSDAVATGRAHTFIAGSRVLVLRFIHFLHDSGYTSSRPLHPVVHHRGVADPHSVVQLEVDKLEESLVKLHKGDHHAIVNVLGENLYRRQVKSNSMYNHLYANFDKSA